MRPERSVLARRAGDRSGVGEELLSQQRFSLFRLSRAWPPDREDYLSLADKGKPVRPPVTDEKVEAWTGLSCYESAERAGEVAAQFSGRWRYIARFDLPIDGSIRWRATFGHGHYTIWATRDELDPFLAPDCHVQL